MATYSWNAPYNPQTPVANDSTRSFVSQMTTAFQTMGLVQTADTGQINPVTVTAPTAANQLIGYQIWRFNDALQSTSPVFFRWEYRTSPNGATTWRFQMQVGTQTDGAGNLLGTQVSAVFSTQAQNGPTDNLPQPCMMSGSSSRFNVCLFTVTPTTQNTMYFGLERSKDASGADTVDGAIICSAWGVNGTHQQQYLPLTPSAGVPPQESRWQAPLPNGNTAAFGNSVGVSLLQPLAGVGLNPGIGTACYLVNDFTPFAQIIMPVYGTNRKYIALPNLTTLNGANASSRAMMLWE